LKELPAESPYWKQLWIDKCISWRSLVGDGFSKATGAGVGVGFSKATGVDSLVLTLVECIVMSEMEDIAWGWDKFCRVNGVYKVVLLWYSTKTKNVIYIDCRNNYSTE